jgi:hypothetical protein
MLTIAVVEEAKRLYLERPDAIYSCCVIDDAGGAQSIDEWEEFWTGDVDHDGDGFWLADLEYDEESSRRLPLEARRAIRIAMFDAYLSGDGEAIDTLRRRIRRIDT